MTDDMALIPQPNPVLRWLSRKYYKLKLLTLRKRLGQPGMVSCDGLALATMPNVFHPVLMRAGVMLGRAVEQLGPPATSSRNRALDMGCGSGVVGAYMARSSYETICVDIDAEAVRLARANALLNGLDALMEVREGDLFAPVAEETFDLICFSPPYYKGEPNDERLSRAFWAGDIMDRFATELPRHLNPDGVALVHLSTDGDTEGFLAPAKAAGLSVLIHSRKVFPNEIMTVYALRLEPGRGQP